MQGQSMDCPGPKPVQPTGEIDPLLIDAIRTASIPTTKVPAPVSKKKPLPAQEPGPEPVSSGMPEAEIMKIQAGLKSFGNDEIGIDGKIGAKTREAVREFQTLCQLAVTGEPNREVFDKLREIGLIAG